ncbi:MAG: hypothetical protein RSE39_08355 [Oscillospiraceae bacterium]
MLMKALDLLRTLGWAIIDFIFGLIDSLFDILREMNAFDIIDSIAQNTIFQNFHKGVIAVALTLLGLFVIWKFVVKVLEPDEGLSIQQIVMETIKCTLLVLLSTFMFAQVSTFSMKLSGWTEGIFDSSSTKLSNSMLELYVDYSDSYEISDDPNIDYNGMHKNIENDNFTDAKMYNAKFVTNDRFILPNEEDYIYSINWIMSIIVGGFFLYALFFSGMMLARRQIEFLFLFIISPVVFATSVGNKNRRGAVIEQLVSLTLQATVVMLIICITALVMQAVNNTIFFNDSFKDIVIKSLMFIGCGTFLLTGSQVVNRFIGGNVSANSGREQMMSLLGFGQTMGGIGMAGGLATAGAGLVGLGAVAKGISGVASGGTSTVSKVGAGISNFGSKLSNKVSSNDSTLSKLGNSISTFGNNMKDSADKKINPINKAGVNVPNGSQKLSRFASRMMSSGSDNIQNAINTIIPNRAMYRRRYKSRGDE